MSEARRRQQAELAAELARQEEEYRIWKGEQKAKFDAQLEENSKEFVDSLVPALLADIGVQVKAEITANETNQTNATHQIVPSSGQNESVAATVDVQSPPSDTPTVRKTPLLDIPYVPPEAPTPPPGIPFKDLDWMGSVADFASTVAGGLAAVGGVVGGAAAKVVKPFQTNTSIRTAKTVKDDTLRNVTGKSTGISRRKGGISFYKTFGLDKIQRGLTSLKRNVLNSEGPKSKGGNEYLLRDALNTLNPSQAQSTTNFDSEIHQYFLESNPADTWEEFKNSQQYKSLYDLVSSDSSLRTYNKYQNAFLGWLGRQASAITKPYTEPFTSNDIAVQLLEKYHRDKKEAERKLERYHMRGNYPSTELDFESDRELVLENQSPRRNETIPELDGLNKWERDGYTDQTSLFTPIFRHKKTFGPEDHWDRGYALDDRGRLELDEQALNRNETIPFDANTGYYESTTPLTPSLKTPIFGPNTNPEKALLVIPTKAYVPDTVERHQNELARSAMDKQVRSNETQLRKVQILSEGLTPNLKNAARQEYGREAMEKYRAENEPSTVNTNTPSLFKSSYKGKYMSI